MTRTTGALLAEHRTDGRIAGFLAGHCGRESSTKAHLRPAEDATAVT